ncbi:MAG: hypothetical protein CLLPBCKN_006516 [Chroococcidiopsis cubana SAG 39.79]|nr:hypothetical protein [Chroococcidiopsis cubana]MDZ4877081.1 hypothetical protein [Chroococcidiopsis cubana SAG 39.79]
MLAGNVFTRRSVVPVVPLGAGVVSGVGGVVASGAGAASVPAGAPVRR